MTKVFEDLLENEDFSLYFLINLSNQKKTIVKWGVLARPGKSFFLPKLLQRHRAVGSHHVDRAHYYHYYVFIPSQAGALSTDADRVSTSISECARGDSRHVGQTHAQQHERNPRRLSLRVFGGSGFERARPPRIPPIRRRRHGRLRRLLRESHPQDHDGAEVGEQVLRKRQIRLQSRRRHVRQYGQLAQVFETPRRKAEAFEQDDGRFRVLLIPLLLLFFFLLRSFEFDRRSLLRRMFADTQCQVQMVRLLRLLPSFDLPSDVLRHILPAIHGRGETHLRRLQGRAFLPLGRRLHDRTRGGEALGA